MSKASAHPAHPANDYHEQRGEIFSFRTGVARQPPANNETSSQAVLPRVMCASRGSTEGSCPRIDTENPFTPERIASIAGLRIESERLHGRHLL
jgi:hypothetical protein